DHRHIGHVEVPDGPVGPEDGARRRLPAALALALFAPATTAGCSRAAEPPPAAAASPPAQAAEAPPAGNGSGTVSGTVSASGTAGGVLEPETAREFPPQPGKPVVEQGGRTLGPRLLARRTGRP